MSDFKRINRTFLAKVESTSGTDASPTVGANAVAVEDPTFGYGFETDETNEVTGSLDRSARYTGGGNGTMSLTAILKGASAGGSAPEISPLLKAAALSETLLAADVTDVLQAGSSTTAIVLASGEISADDLYVGQIFEMTDGGEAGEQRIIIDSVASTDTITVWPALSGSPSVGEAYKINAGALYTPASDSIPTLSAYLYQHKTTAGNHRLEKLLGAAVRASLNIPVRRVGRWSFELTGQLTAPADVTDPGAATYDGASKPVLTAAMAYLDSNVVKFSEVSFDLGNEVETADDPTATYGYDVGAVVRRRITGRINPRTELVATRNAFSDIANATTRKLWLLFGTGDGGKVSIYVPQARFIAHSDADNRGFAHEGLDFDCEGTDTGIYITVF